MILSRTVFFYFLLGRASTPVILWAICKWFFSIGTFEIYTPFDHVTQSFTFEGDATIKTGSQIRGLRIVWISQDNQKKKELHVLRQPREAGEHPIPSNIRRHCMFYKRSFSQNKNFLMHKRTQRSPRMVLGTPPGKGTRMNKQSETPAPAGKTIWGSLKIS